MNIGVLKKCSGAVILYDISDKRLNPIISSDTYSKNNFQMLMSTQSPLVKYICNLQYKTISLLGLKIWGWYNAINFVTYGKENLSASDYEMIHEKLNSFTCELEHYYKVDNKWGRGHQDLSTDNSWKKTLFWISGEARRSIADRWVQQ